MGFSDWQVLRGEWRGGGWISMLPKDIVNLIGWYLIEDYNCYMIGYDPMANLYGDYKMLPMPVSDVSSVELFTCVISNNIIYGIGLLMVKYTNAPELFYNFGLTEDAARKLMVDLSINPNKLQIWGHNGSLKITTYLPFFDFTSINERVVKLSCGDHHGVILTEKGNCYTFGSNYNLQLGIKFDADYNFISLVATDVTDIAADSENTYIVKNGRIYQTMNPKGANTIYYDSSDSHLHPINDGDKVTLDYANNEKTVIHTYAYISKYDPNIGAFQPIINMNGVTKIYSFSTKLMFIRNGEIYIIMSNIGKSEIRPYYKILSNSYFTIPMKYKDIYKVSNLSNVSKICNKDVFVTVENGKKTVYIGDDELIKVDVDYEISEIFSNELSNIILIEKNINKEIVHIYGHMHVSRPTHPLRPELVETNKIRFGNITIKINDIENIKNLVPSKSVLFILTSPTH